MLTKLVTHMNNYGNSEVEFKKLKPEIKYLSKKELDTIE
jgi:hypothetical protein